MTTRTEDPRRRTGRITHWALALGAAVTAGGCGAGQAPGAPVRAPAPQARALEVRYSPDGAYSFAITFDAKGCPTSALASLLNCPADASGAVPKDCVRARKREKVSFVATPPAPFLLQFDPFKKGTFKPNPAGETIDAFGMPGKPYTFNVLSDPPDRCAPLDPQIIVD